MPKAEKEEGKTQLLLLKPRMLRDLSILKGAQECVEMIFSFCL